MKYRLERRRGELVIRGEEVDYVGGYLRRLWERAFEGFGLYGRAWERVLLVGMGASLMQLLARAGAPPPAYVTIIEKDPEMAYLQETHYELSLPYELILEDAAKALSNLSGKYDGIFLDAFEEKSIPSSLLEVAFVQRLAQFLCFNGVLLWNAILPPQQRLVKERLEAAFPLVYKRRIWENTVFLACWDRAASMVFF